MKYSVDVKRVWCSLSEILPKSVLVAWILVTLFVPTAIFFWLIAGNMALVGSTVYSLLWIYSLDVPNYDFMGTSIFGIFLPVDPSSVFFGVHILNPLILMWVPLYGGFNILFAVQVVRYVKGKASARSSILLGLLTLAMPLFEAVVYLPHVLAYDIYLPYLGPIPIQLIIGLIIMKKYAPKPLDTPWEGNSTNNR